MKDATAEMGHNNGPAFNPEVVEELMAKAREFADAAGEWKDRGAIADEPTAEKANDFLAGARKLFKEAEDRRKLEKQPHLDAGREVDTAFKDITGMIEASSNAVKPLLADYMRAKEEAERKAQQEAEAKARAEREEAERKARQAEQRNDVAGQQEAEAAKAAAERAAEEAAKPAKANVASATGGGRTAALRTHRHAEISNINSAMLHYRSNPEMQALILRLANAEIRAAKGEPITIPGVTIKEERKL